MPRRPLRAGRTSLLLGTALASTLLIGSLLTSAPSVAQTVGCLGMPPPGSAPAPIEVDTADDIVCNNTEEGNRDRNNQLPQPPNARAVIDLTTTGNGTFIDLDNRGELDAYGGDSLYGIYARGSGGGNSIDIDNRGSIEAYADDNRASGIYARADDDSSIVIENRGGIEAAAGTYNAFGISTRTYLSGNYIDIENRGNIEADAGSYGALGISALAFDGDNTIVIENRGNVEAAAVDFDAFGIYARAFNGDNTIVIENRSGIKAAAGINAYGIYTSADGGNNTIFIENRGGIEAAAGIYDAFGIRVSADGGNNTIVIENHGDIEATAGADRAYGILAVTSGDDSAIEIENDGTLTATTSGFGSAFGITAVTQDADSPIDIVNSGNITARAGFRAFGIDARAFGVGTPITVRNSGNIVSESYIATGIYAVSAYGPVTIMNSGKLSASGNEAWGINSFAFGPDTPIGIVNSGDIAVTSETYGAYGIGITTLAADGAISIENRSRINVTSNGAGRASGIRAFAAGANSPVDIVNSGDITASAAGSDYYSQAHGIYAASVGTGSPISIRNSGNVFASGLYSTGVFALSLGSDIVIVNTGSISASSLVAINAVGLGNRGATIINYGGGVITGLVDLTDNDDRFFNQPGGVFETKLTSDFGGGNDLFRNETGGTVQAATDPGARERSTIVNLERFENRGLISMVDGRVGDTFTIMNTSPAARDLTFVASGNSALAVDAFLGGPGSVADEFIVYGDISGRTALHVNNTNPTTGSAGAVIPVIVAESDNVKPDAFYLAQPIDTGFFDYDLFFRPTGSGVFELRSFVGGGALLLPQLVTGAQDIWHATSSTWFDRTADLRVLLAGGGSPIAYDPTAGYADGAPSGFTPAVWARGGGNWLDRQGSETVNAFGNNYRFKLDRDLEIMDFQMGLDLGKRDFLSQGDILVFGMLGGFVNADLDYDQLVRRFDFEGGQVGGYATYLKGGLFVDTLLNVHLLDLETATQGFPSSLDATTVGLRTDTGYRFGSFNGGTFIEPLATLAVLWSDIDGFTAGANRISFEDEANVRGRLGLRVGTSYAAWTGTTIEPFVIGSLWGNLSGDNQATLVSNGTNFRFEDDLDDVWGEVSAGVNFFNPSAATAVFAKVDVTFGDDVDGIGGKAGMRVAW